MNNDLDKRIAELFKFMKERLKLNETPKVVITKDKNNSDKPFGLTGYYDPDSKTIRLYITDRHPTDILRSFAHEVIHHWQNENDKFTKEKEDDSSLTGEHYAQKNPWMRQMEKQAYLLGNLIFRDWQDEKRYGKVETPEV
jgi:hypothetical protein